jgi:predicted dehydrogenase
MKILQVGLGSMGKRRIRNLQHLRAGEIIGFDPREDRREEASTRYGIRAFGTMEEALDQRPGVMVISTPPDLHIRYASLAAQNSMHFFTEAGVSFEGVPELLKVTREKGLVAAPSCTLRFHPIISLMKEIVDSGELGRILAFTYQSGQYLPDWHPWEDYRTFYVAKRETGACREIVPFELVWLTWILGPVQAVSCMKGKLTKLDVDIDDIYQLLLTFQTGAIGHLMVDVIARSPVRVCRFMSEEGLLEWIWSDKKLRVYTAAKSAWKEYEEPQGSVEQGYIHAETPYIREMEHFMNAVEGKGAYSYTFEDDMQILKVLHSAEESFTDQRHITLA